MKIILILLITLVKLSAINNNGLFVGNWHSVSQVNNKGTITIEKEYLSLNANNTFSILLLVSVQKGNAFVKDLQIKASGIWKVHKETLVYVIKKIDVPFAKEVYRISQDSLVLLANFFKKRFEGQPIRIVKIRSINTNVLDVTNEEGVKTHYTR